MERKHKSLTHQLLSDTFKLPREEVSRRRGRATYQEALIEADKTAHELYVQYQVDAVNTLKDLMKHKDPKIRLQAAREFNTFKKNVFEVTGNLNVERRVAIISDMTPDQLTAFLSDGLKELDASTN